ncbi:MAG: hypothetical protein MI754_18945 [Chromatiales bacterium]|nr:hypothetical protein [Chromatiales bacterium]
MAAQTEGLTATVHSDIFLSSELTQKTNLLLHLTENSDRIALIKGADKSGKSTFLSYFVANAPSNWLVCRINADPLMQPDQLLGLLGDCFDAQIETDMLEHYCSGLSICTWRGECR